MILSRPEHDMVVLQAMRFGRRPLWTIIIRTTAEADRASAYSRCHDQLAFDSNWEQASSA